MIIQNVLQKFALMQNFMKVFYVHPMRLIPIHIFGYMMNEIFFKVIKILKVHSNTNKFLNQISSSLMQRSHHKFSVQILFFQKIIKVVPLFIE